MDPRTAFEDEPTSIDLDRREGRRAQGLGARLARAHRDVDVRLAELAVCEPGPVRRLLGDEARDAVEGLLAAEEQLLGRLVGRGGLGRTLDDAADGIGAVRDVAHALARDEGFEARLEELRARLSAHARRMEHEVLGAAARRLDGAELEALEEEVRWPG